MKLTYKNILILRQALNALEGREKAVDTRTLKGELECKIVVKPYKFGGKTRLKIARNLRAVEAAFEDYDAARVGLVRELADGAEKVPEDRLGEFNRRHEELLKEESDVALTTLEEAELNLDDNDVPHGALAVLLAHLVA